MADSDIMDCITLLFIVGMWSINHISIGSKHIVVDMNMTSEKFLTNPYHTFK